MTDQDVTAYLALRAIRNHFDGHSTSTDLFVAIDKSLDRIADHLRSRDTGLLDHAMDMAEGQHILTLQQALDSLVDYKSLDRFFDAPTKSNPNPDLSLSPNTRVFDPYSHPDDNEA